MKILAITLKDLKILLRDTGTLITLIVQPLIFIIVLSLLLGQSFDRLGKSNPIKVLLVNNDEQGALTSRFLTNLKTLGASGDLIFEQTSPDGKKLDTSTAQSLIKERQREFAILIAPNFSSKLANGEKVEVLFMTDPSAAQQVARPVQGAVLAALSQTVTPLALGKSINNALQQNLPPEVAGPLAERITFALQNSDGSNLATVQQVAPPGVTIEKYPTAYQQNVPGYTIMYIFFIVSLMATSVMQERQDGTFRRLLAAPVGKFSILLGKFFPYYIASLLQVCILFGAGALLFGMNLGREPLALIPITLALAACATSLGLLVAALATNQQQLGGVSILIIVMAALGGCMVPPVFVGDFLNKIMVFTPHGQALRAYQDIMVRGLGLVEVLPACGILLAIAGLFFSLAVARFRFI